MKQTQNSGNSACKFSISPGFARLKNLLSTKRARTITAMFAFFASLLSLCFLQNPSFASLLRTPATYLNISTSTPNVDFQFNQSELSSSAFKTNSVTVSIQTDNTAGATTYISSIDEATSLVHSAGISDSITSISSPLLSTAFSGKTWGYRVGSLATTAFNPIPKVSAPAEILNTTSATPASNNLNIDFGVKVSPDLSSGTYSKQILFTSITNHLPTTATFLMGKTFNDRVTTYNTGKSVKNFKHSLTPPPNMGNAIVVSIPTSEKPIYLWHDSISETDFWWTEADVAYANEDMSNMFTQNLGSNHLDLVDLRGINTSKSKSAICMFGCSGNYLFPGYTGSIKMNISAIDFSEFDSSNILDMSYMFAGFNADIWGHCINQANLDFSKINTSNVKSMKEMFSRACVPNLRSLNFDTSKVEDMDGMFNLTDNGMNELDVSSFDTRSLKTARAMFMGSNFTKINVSGWRNDVLNDMQDMFASMGLLTEINISNFRTNNVTNMTGTFRDNHELRLLDLSSFDTNKVKSMASLFSGLYKVTNINLSSFDTSNVESMFYMFYACAELASLSLNHFNTSKVTDMQNMFAGLKISSLDLSSFNTTRVTNMQKMFSSMINLTDLNLSSFDTSNVTNMNGMFYDSMQTPIRSTLDLSSFNTNNLVQAKDMFNNMNVKTIYVSPSFNVDNVTNSSNMMKTLWYIVGGNGTTYSNSNPTDKTYARIDAPGAPGYFTQKP